MNWNLPNIMLFSASLLLIVISGFKLFFVKKNQTFRYLHWFIILESVTIIQIVLINVCYIKESAVVIPLCFPFHFLSPVFLTAFTLSYLNKTAIFKKYRFVLLVPFILSFLLYIYLNINILTDYTLLSEQIATYINAEQKNNAAIVFFLGMCIWNYKTINNYDNSFGNLPYDVVVKKTKWLKTNYNILIGLYILWGLTVVSVVIVNAVEILNLFYLLWCFFAMFLYFFSFWGSRHLSAIVANEKKKRQKQKENLSSFQILGLNKIFSPNELIIVDENSYETTSILSYFATSLFDKSKQEEVLWDIVKNCSEKLNLEDCVIYLLNEKRDTLIQKSVYGNKNKGNQKILNSIEIPLGKGIVGAAAKKRKPELVNNSTKDKRYILDDAQRMSELAVPIIYENQLQGVLDSEHSQKDFFQERHLFLFQLIAKLTATKLHHITKNNSSAITNDNVYYKQLCYLLEKEKIYRNPELSLSIISERLTISSTYISQLVNKLSNSNFSDFVNAYRINDAKQKLSDPNFSIYTILSIGLESGFNSKSTFYTAFKKHTGITPTEYRENPILS